MITFKSAALASYKERYLATQDQILDTAQNDGTVTLSIVLGLSGEMIDDLRSLLRSGALKEAQSFLEDEGVPKDLAEKAVVQIMEAME